MSAKSLRRLFAVATLLGACSAVGVLAAPPRPEEISNPDITAAEIRAHVRYLASEELEGRGSGTRGNDLAADYLADRFRALGLKPAGEKDTFFQTFPIFTGVELGDNNRLSFRQGSRNRQLQAGTDYLPLGFSQNGYAYAPVVFAGYGISKPELKYDDYKGLDVRGKIVIVLRHTPDMDPDGPFGPYAQLTYKVMTAREKGAAGILLVTGPLGEHPIFFDRKPAVARSGRLELPAGSASADAGIPAAIVHPKFVDELLRPKDRTLRDLQIMIAHGTTHSFEIPNARVGLNVNVVRQTSPTRNVIGLLEGSDPKLKDEVIVVGAHYDHLGHGNEHSLAESRDPAIHFGADDNASGTSGVLELAQYFAHRRERLGRSLLFMGFSGEELGLLGSNYWVKNPTVPFRRIAAMVNMDMIGRMRNGTLNVLGSGSSPAWKSLLEQVNQTHKLELRTGGASGFGGSDQQSFYAQGVPVLFFFTGIHPDYHRPSDTWEKVDAEATERLLRFAADTTERISRLPERPAFTRSPDQEPQAPAGGFPVYIGTIPDYGADVEGVQLQGVREDSPAEKAGMRAGDILIEFAGTRIRNVQEYTTVLRDAKPNAPVKVVVLRNKQQVTLQVTPARRN